MSWQPFGMIAADTVWKKKAGCVEDTLILYVLDSGEGALWAVGNNSHFKERLTIMTAVKKQKK